MKNKTKARREVQPCTVCGKKTRHKVKGVCDGCKAPDKSHESAFNSGDLINAMCGGNRIPQRGKL